MAQQQRWFCNTGFSGSRGFRLSFPFCFSPHPLQVAPYTFFDRNCPDYLPVNSTIYQLTSSFSRWVFVLEFQAAPMFEPRRNAKARSVYPSVSCHDQSLSNQLRLRLLDQETQPASHKDRVGHLNQKFPRYSMCSMYHAYFSFCSC